MEPADIIEIRPHVSGQTRASSFLALTLRDRAIAQVAIDTLSHLTSVPLTLVVRPEPKTLFTKIRRESRYLKEPFKQLAEFHAFVKEAQRSPEEILRRLNSRPAEWRPIFEILERDLVFARSRRQEPVVRLFRDHWAWRWLELLSIYHSGLENDGSQPLGWQSDLSGGLFTSTIAAINGARLRVIVGPLRLLGRHRYQPEVNLLRMVECFYNCLSEPLGPLYSIERLSQFFFSSAPLSLRSVDLVSKRLVDAQRILRSYKIPDNRTIELSEIQGAVHFAYALAGLANDKNIVRSSPLEELQVTARFDALFVEDRGLSRELFFEGSLRRISGVSGARDRQLTASHLGDRAGISGFPPGRDLAPARKRRLQRALGRELERVRSTAQAARTQQNLEELLLLRYKLHDNLGVLSVDEGSPREKPLQQTADRQLGRRLAREIAQITCGSAAVIYRYDYRMQNLVMVGGHVEGPAKRVVSQRDYRWMEEIGRDPVKRESSIAYHVADHNRIASFNAFEATPDLVDRTDAHALPPERSIVPIANSVLATPIRVFDRIWGVIEILSPHPEWFDVADLEVLQRIGDLIGPYYHEHVLMRLLRQMADVSVADGPGPAFKRLSNHVREMTLSDACCIWVSDMVNADEFVLAGSSGRRDLTIDDDDQPRIHRDSQNSVALQLIARGEGWFAGEIGSYPFAGDWLNKTHTKSLADEGFKYIALLPVQGDAISRKAVISLYSKRSSFNERWRNWGTFIASYVGVVLNRVLSVADDERRARRLVAHEVENARKIVQESSDKLFDWVEKNSKGRSIHPNLNMWRSDIATHLDLVRSLISTWTGAKRVEGQLPPELTLLATIEKRISESPPTAVSFRDEFHSSFQPLSKQMKRRQIEFSLTIPQGDVWILVHKDAIRMVLSNLSANAVKYSSAGAVIKCLVTEEKYGFRFSISNLGKPLAAGEAQRIFDMSYRGAHTRRSVAGSGLGLYIVKQICEAYDIAVSYDARPGGKSGDVWHQFSLEFPANRVDSWGWL